MFNTIQIYGKELFDEENIVATILIGLLILFFIHKLFFDKNQAIAPPEDIKQCLQRFNSSKIYTLYMHTLLFKQVKIKFFIFKF